MSVTWELTRPKFSDQGLNLGHHSESVFSAWGNNLFYCYQFSSSSVQSLSHVRLFVTPWTAGRQASLSITNSGSLLKLMSIKSVMPSNHLILCHLLLLPPSVFPSIRVFSNESVLRIWWPKYWSFSFSISPSNEYSGLISFSIGWSSLVFPLGLTLRLREVRDEHIYYLDVESEKHEPKEQGAGCRSLGLG